MKTKFITAAGALMALWLIPPTNAIAAIDLDGFTPITVCRTLSLCKSSATSACKTYCCPTGETQTDYTCPTNWVYDLLSGVCKRSGSSSGSDSKGSYTTTYGTCAATTSTYDCYETSDSATVTIDGSTYKCQYVTLPASCGGN